MASKRPRSPSQDRYAAENPTVGVHMPLAQRNALAARAKEAGVTMSAIILGDRAALDLEQAAAVARAEAAIRKAVSGELSALRGELATVQAAVADQLRVAKEVATQQAQVEWIGRQRQWQTAVASRDDTIVRLRSELVQVAQAQERRDELSQRQNHVREQALEEERESWRMAAVEAVDDVKHELAAQFDAALDPLNDRVRAVTQELADTQQRLGSVQTRLKISDLTVDGLKDQLEAVLIDPARKALEQLAVDSKRRDAEREEQQRKWDAEHEARLQELAKQASSKTLTPIAPRAATLGREWHPTPRDSTSSPNARGVQLWSTTRK